MIGTIARAKFATICPWCQGDIRPGDPISFERSPKARHWACSPKAAPKPPEPVSPWQPFLGRTITVRRGDSEVTGTCFRTNDRWWLNLNYAGYERSTYSRPWDLRDSDTVVAQS